MIESDQIIKTTGSKTHFYFMAFFGRSWLSNIKFEIANLLVILLLTHFYSWDVI